MSQVIALAGRRIDAPQAKQPRFPLEQAGVVEQRLSRLFQEVKASALVCSACCGADLIALQVAGAQKLRRRIVLPFAPEQFRQTSVTDRPDERWGALFDRTLAEVQTAGELVVLSDPGDDAQAYAAANVTILQEAQALCSSQPGTTALAVIVWDGLSRGEDDATEAFARLARSSGIPVHEVLTF
ncbi:MAG TPA: hypothetical protein VF815_42685 [Myxococcaceae bacterium]|jgi:hypothetical protein